MGTLCQESRHVGLTLAVFLCLRVGPEKGGLKSKALLIQTRDCLHVSTCGALFLPKAASFQICLV